MPAVGSQATDAPPLVSVLVPCRQEGRYIVRFLDSLLAGIYPRDRLEVLVLDGESEDGTREIVEEYARRHAFIRVIRNRLRTTPAALNAGLSQARGEIIVRMDVHAEYPPEYIMSLVTWLRNTDADNVGAAAVTAPGSNTAMGRAIAHGLAHPLGVGNSWFRIGVREPRWVDTVPFGCFRRDVFERVGTFDEELIRNQDDELNARLRRAGGRILLVPDVTFRYHARESLGKLWHMYFQYGYFKPLAVWRGGGLPTLRQLVPAGFVGALLVSIVLALVARTFWPVTGLVTVYLAVLLAAAAVAARATGAAAAACLPAVFAALHAGYGLGYLAGLLRMLVPRGRGRRPGAAVPLSR